MIRLILTIGVTTWLLGGLGCGGKAAEPGAPISARMPSLAESVMDARESFASAGAMSDNGLEVHMWLVGDNGRVLEEAFEAHCESIEYEHPGFAALAANGFRVYRTPLDRVSSLRTDVGGTSRSEQWWFGQVPTWRELWSRSLGTNSRGIAVDGRVRRLTGGVLSILIRSWTMKTEFGPRMQFEISPYYSLKPGGFREALNEAQRAVFGSREPTGEVFATMAASARLQPGTAYILTCDFRKRSAAPVVDVTPEEGEVRGNVGPGIDFGPEAAGPATLGDILLRGDDDEGNRLVIILVPRVPRALFPPGDGLGGAADIGPLE